MSISVVIPVHNRETQVLCAIESVVRQGNAQFEVVVVDDGSTDNTAAAVQSVADPRVRLVRQTKSGAARARNAGAAAARGTWLTFLDSDDEALPGWLERFATAFQTPLLPRVAFCGIRENGMRPTVHQARPLGPAFSNMTGIFLAGTYALERDIFLRVGGFDEQLPASQHTELALRLSDYVDEFSVRCAIVPEVGVIYHRHQGDSIRKDDAAIALASARILERHGPRLARDPKFLADMLATGAVRAIRSGDIATGRRWLWQSALKLPTARAFARAVVGSVPAVARRFWRATQRR
jgi:glycosyltransferase involved in cell wall biosynthesis